MTNELTDADQWPSDEAIRTSVKASLDTLIALSLKPGSKDDVNLSVLVYSLGAMVGSVALSFEQPVQIINSVSIAASNTLATMQRPEGTTIN